MAPLGSPQTPRRSSSTRLRTSARPKSATATSLAERAIATGISSEPPRKRLKRYIPGALGGSGRYTDDTGNHTSSGSPESGGYNYLGLRGRIGRETSARNSAHEVYNTRERSVRQTRTVAPRSEQPQMRFTSAAQAAAVVQSDGFKPREERAWEEFHPDMDIEMALRAFSTSDIEGNREALSETPAGAPPSKDVNGEIQHNGTDTAKAGIHGVPTPAVSVNGDTIMMLSIPGTPGGGKRRPGRPPKDPVAFFAAKAAKLGKSLNLGGIHLTPKAQKTLPLITNINAKEKLTLPQPSYRKTDTLARFDDKSLGLVRYVDKSMANVGYQESDIFQRPEHNLIKAFDANADDDVDINPGYQSDGGTIAAIAGGGVGRVEYDMDEQDDKWLQTYNKERKGHNFEPITREVFEITMTKVEKEWHLLEKRIPKPNPKPPQTQRPRSSSAAAVNGEPQLNEEQDSKCAICDDGDCENTNAIVFCDGCDTAVHQECYGVPFIPEGQWLCRKCQLIGRGIPTCIFCPNTDGAFKQTNASKWAHLLCAMWIPEVSLGNHTFMEPVMDAERVPKNRWKLVCYLCEQRMGACIQCADKHCYEAFHPTCARRAGLYLRMKNDHGTLAFLDGSTEMEARCHRHVPAEHEQEHNTQQATADAIQFYKKTMKGRIWASSQASASVMAASHRHAYTEHHPDDSQLTGVRNNHALNENKKRGNQQQKNVWKLPSGAPVIPQVVFNSVEKSLQRFNIHKRREYSADACRYWTLKREARRGAALLKRLQLQMETFSSMELTRRNWAGMGSAGRPRLARRIDFAQSLISDLEKLKSLADDVLARETEKLKAAQYEVEVVDTVYFAVAKFFMPILEKSLSLDIKTIFQKGLTTLQDKVKQRQYTTIMSFVNDFSAVLQDGVLSEPPTQSGIIPESDNVNVSPAKKSSNDLKERRRFAKRILKAIQPQLDLAAQAEAEISGKPFQELLQEAEQRFNGCLTAQPPPDLETKPVKDTTDGVDNDETVDAEQNDLLQRPMTEKDPDSIEVEMPDVDAPGDVVEEEDEQEKTVIVAEPASSIGSPLSAIIEYDDNMLPTKGLTNGDTLHDTVVSKPDDYVPNTSHVTPPTPPVSTNETSENVDVLLQGGIPWHVKEFEPEGTSLVGEVEDIQETMTNIDVSNDEDEVMGEDDTASIVTTSTPAAKKARAKPKKKGKSRR